MTSLPCVEHYRDTLSMCGILLLTVILNLNLVTSLETAHGHAHGDVGDKPTSFTDSKVLHDTDHILEHYEGVAKMNESGMSTEELEFHYFKLHDFDNNTKLDGLEMYKALTHMLPYEEIKDTLDQIDRTGKTAEQVLEEEQHARMKYYTEIIDTVLQEDDIDNDGYLSYTEYVVARRREELREAAEQSRNIMKEGRKEM